MICSQLWQKAKQKKKKKYTPPQIEDVQSKIKEALNTLQRNLLPSHAPLSSLHSKFAPSPLQRAESESVFKLVRRGCC